MMPNFLIIGAAKSGTTALYQCLKQHPQIYMSPIKETEFFTFEGEKINFQGPGDMPRLSITDIKDYQAQFRTVSTELAIGEASPSYLYSKRAPERIQHYIPDIKLIAILRDPVERAYSQFLMFSRDCREPISEFEQALQEEPRRIRNNWSWGWHYTQVGLYATQLKRYFSRFDREQIQVYLYEDLKNDPSKLLKNIFKFIGVNCDFSTKIYEKNISGLPKNLIWQSLIRRPSFIKNQLKPFLNPDLRRKIVEFLERGNLVRPHLSSELRSELIQVYRQEIIELEDLIQRDLSKWLES